MRPELEKCTIHPFANWDIPGLIDSQAKLLAEKPFLIWEPFEGEAQTWSYQQFANDSKRLAAGLQARGIQQGDYVLVHMDNSPEFLLAWTACARVGAIAVTTNTRSAADEISYFVEHSKAVAAITQPKYAALLKNNCKGLSWVAVTELNSDSTTDGDLSGCDGFDQLYGEAEKFIARPADPTLPLLVMYTSGTTSRPKGVVWTHGNGLWAGRSMASQQLLTADDVHLIFLPLFHMNALAISTLSTLWAGATAVLQPRFSASRFWDVALKHKCTWCSIIPFCIRALASQPVPEHHFKYWGIGAILPDVEKHFKVTSYGWWGMTETTSVGIVSSPNQENMPRALGRPSPFYDIAIVSDDGGSVKAGETGDLRIRGIPGVTLFAEYLHNLEATEASFDEEGYFITGDRATLLEDGSIKFGDRSKDMLKVGGENVAASEIEAVIMEAGGVREVAVVAKQDPMLDQVPVAFVIPADKNACSESLASNIENYCTEKLADFKRPREVRVVEDMPRAALDKIAKNELRKLLVAK